MPLILQGATSGQATVQATDAATVTLTLPATSGTLAVGGTTPTFTTLTVTGDATIRGITVGQGGGSTGTNTALGFQSLNGTNSGAGFNIGVGYQAAFSNTSGQRNSVVGVAAMYTNTTGSQNTAIGMYSLYSNTTAPNNTAVGYQAGYGNTTGQENTAVGASALYSNTTGSANTALAKDSLYSNTTGGNNTAAGYYSLIRNTTGGNNVAIGVSALEFNTTASGNTAVGYQAGYSTTTGANNVFIGGGAGYTATTATISTIVGYQAGYSISAGTASRNTFIGSYAGNSVTTGSGNTFVGGVSTGGGNGAGRYITTGSQNTILGGYDGNQNGLDIRTASNRIVISDGDGNPRQLTNGDGFLKVSNNAVWIGVDSFSHEIMQSRVDSYALRVGITAASGGGFPMQLAWVNQTNNNTTDRYLTCSDATNTKLQIFSNGNVQNLNGSYGTISDIKNKENIVDATPKLDKLLALKVRNFNLKDDDTKLKQIGFIAQEFEEVFPSMIEESPDLDIDGNKTGETTKAIKTTVLVPILVKAIQELNAKVTALEAQLGAK